MEERQLGRQTPALPVPALGAKADLLVLLEIQLAQFVRQCPVRLDVGGCRQHQRPPLDVSQAKSGAGTRPGGDQGGEQEKRRQGGNAPGNGRFAVRAEGHAHVDLQDAKLNRVRQCARPGFHCRVRRPEYRYRRWRRYFLRFFEKITRPSVLKPVPTGWKRKWPQRGIEREAAVPADVERRLPGGIRPRKTRVAPTSGKDNSWKPLSIRETKGTASIRTIRRCAASAGPPSSPG
ncbi:MAG: hypothetical protein QM739_06220 [Propionivibrio sp.]